MTIAITKAKSCSSAKHNITAKSANVQGRYGLLCLSSYRGPSRV